MQQNKPDARSLLCDLYSLSVLRPLLKAEGLAALSDFLNAALDDDSVLMRESYFRMHSCMLGAPRLTGEVFRDYWLFMLLSRGYSRFDALGRASLARDLGVVQWFCRIGGKSLWDIARTRGPGGTGDNIVRLAGAAWGGAAVETIRKPPSTAARQSFDYPLWQYEVRDSEMDYCAGNDMLALMDAFEHREDWAELADEVIAFYAEHGDVSEFCHKHSYFDGERLLKLTTDSWPEWDEFVGLDAARSALLGYAEAFISDQGAQNVLVHGEAGLGKTMLCCALAKAGPLRLIVTAAHNFERLSGILSRVAGQPMRFIVLVDGVDGECGALRDYASFIQPPNVWVLATGRELMPFGTALMLEPPPLKAFIQRVMELGRARGVELDYDSVQDVCIDWKVDGGDLTASAALRVLSKLL